MKKCRGPAGPRHFLQDDTDESAGTLVDDALEGLLKLAPGILRHPLELGVQILADQLVEGAAKDVGLPDGFGVTLELLEQIVDHLFRLLLIAHDGRDLGFDVGPDHMYCLEQTEVLLRPRCMVNFSSSESTFR